MPHPVRFLIRQELRRYPLPALFTGLFFAFFGFMLGGLLIASNQFSSDTSDTVRFIQQANVDWVMLALTSTLGFVFTKDYFNYHRSDVFTRRLAFYRRLPVRNEDLLRARFLLMLMTLALMSACHYIPMMAMVAHGNDPTQSAFGTTPLAFVGAALTWTGFSLVAGSLYIYFEFTLSGKKYLQLSMLLAACYLTVIMLLSLTGIHLGTGSFRLAEDYGFFPALVSLAAGAAGARAIYLATLRRMATRDLT